MDIKINVQEQQFIRCSGKYQINENKSFSWVIWRTPVTVESKDLFLNGFVFLEVFFKK